MSSCKNYLKSNEQERNIVRFGLVIRETKVDTSTREAVLFLIFFCLNAAKNVLRNHYLIFVTQM